MPYRDDVDALSARLRSLEQEQHELDQKRRELDRTTVRLEVVNDALADVRARLEHVRKRPRLDDLEIASPCSASWDDMIGDERVRFCGSCAKNVYDVAAMTRAEAEAVIAAHEEIGEVCMRLYKRRDGMVLTADCPVGRRRKRRVRIAAGVVAGAGVGLSMMALAATRTMGNMRATSHRYDHAHDGHMVAVAVEVEVEEVEVPPQEPRRGYRPPMRGGVVSLRSDAQLFRPEVQPREHQHRGDRGDGTEQRDHHRDPTRRPAHGGGPRGPRGAP